jgi:hypothetical protein
MKDKKMNAKTIKVIKDSIKNHDKLKSFDNTEDAMNWLTDKIEQLEDKKLHENEFGFDMLCEKYVDDCAMKLAAVMFEQFYLKNYKTMINYGDVAADIAEVAYDAAEAMLKEKLKRKNDR